MMDDMPGAPEWLREFWRCKKWIEEALESSAIRSLTVGDIFAMIAKGAAQLHPGKACCFVTTIDHFKTTGVRVISVYAAGGDLKEMEEMAPKIEAWAQSQGCTHVFIKGRRGWERSFLRTQGYQVDQVVLVKELNNAKPD